MLGTAGPMEPALRTFRHEALLYAGDAAFLEGTVPFIEAGLAAGEPLLAMVTEPKIDLLRRALGPDAGRVAFTDMGTVGRNPARIIPVWRDFLAERGTAGPARGISEPVFPQRTAEELVECQRHEALVNLAFAGGSPWRLLCTYDTSSLHRDVVDAAGHSHPFLTDGQRGQESRSYRGHTWSGPTHGGLTEPLGAPPVLTFGTDPWNRCVSS